MRIMSGNFPGKVHIMFPWMQIGKTKEKKTRAKILPILNHSSDFLDLILICKSSLTGKECFFSFK